MLSQAVAEKSLAAESGREVFQDLDAEFQRLRDAGLVDLKTKVFVSRETTVRRLSWVMTHVLRQYRAGKAKTLNII